MEKEGGDKVQQPCVNTEKSNVCLENSPAKTKGSMFSVKGWNQMASKNVQEKEPHSIKMKPRDYLRTIHTSMENFI